MIKILNIYLWLVMIRAILSWVHPRPQGGMVRLLYLLTEPVLKPIRQVVPPVAGVDFSPAILFLIAALLQYLI